MELRIGNRKVASTRPVHGHFVLAVPHAYLDGRRHFAILLYNSFGARVQPQGLFFKAG